MKTIPMIAATWLAFAVSAVAGVLEFRTVAQPGEDFAIELPLGEESLKLRAPEDLNEADLKMASGGFVPDEGNILHLDFNEKGAPKLFKITKENLGKRLAIIVNGKVLMAPNVMEPIAGGSGQVPGWESAKEAEEVAATLNEASAKVSKDAPRPN
ncbi:SecDF P1 head subdomain-containing protein [Sulfuriroseicoccus oceanibius]|uniref:SecDF P1 head subdomain domain-containing protein n=1 Tax=Sulfuriroseicoccus oceanibius TaxID=2707525 RepID=A0A6B3LDM3_9BACT|nr:hypothetical protein [Sulfuriroseicoccus oceanibius]QQL45287.1 hypothetical protein G3M56_001490 [Sulfuriroseicoccus oceanibius]